MTRWDDESSLAGSVPRQVELLTSQFYDWELRGRGWQLHPFPVALEPPFVPFRSHWVPPLEPGIDDGRKPTMLSRLADGVGRFVRGGADSSETDDDDSPDEPDIMALKDDSPVVELRLSVPPSFRISRDAVEQLLVSLPVGSGPLAFEVIGNHDTVTVQITAREPGAARVARQLQAHFPEIVITHETQFLQTTWGMPSSISPVIVDFGLSREFMLPVRTFKGFDIDPLIAVTAAVSDLEAGEVALVQVLFEPLRHPWAASVMRSVLDGEGKPFFMDAPEIASAAKAKVARPLYGVVLRIAVRCQDLGRAWQVARALGGSLRSFASPTGNEFIPLSNDDYDDADHEEDVLFRRSRRAGMILNSEELVSIVHPPSASVRIEKLKREDRKSRAAPALAAGPGLLVGTNTHAGKTAEVRLTPDQRSRHMYVIGASGTGKSTLFHNLILQDLQSGQGLAVLDPHGDLVDRVLECVPDERTDDVILLDPADAEWPVGFNILSAHSDLERTLLSSDLVAVFRRLSTSWGDQMTSVLGNAILAFLESDQGGTLIDLRRFLVEKSYRDGFLTTVRDPEVVYYWQKEFPLLKGNPQASILTRLDTFLRPKLIRHMVAQRDDRLDFRRMMDQGKILLARLSQGAIGEENAHLLGSLLVAKLQQTAMSRQEMAEKERRPFYVYIDEFQNFVTPTMEQILSGARKYRLCLILAHHELRQLASRSPEVQSSVLTHPYTRICFRVGDQDARTLSEGFASFDSKDLQNLGIGQAVARIERAEFDFNLDTQMLPAVDVETAQRTRERVINRSREQFGRRRQEIEEALRVSAPALPKTEAPSVARQPSPPVTAKPNEPPVIPEASTVPRSVELPPGPAASPGRGGQQHRYLQELIRRWAESHDWRATIEEGILDGLGSVDVALKQGDRSVACEIAVTSTAEHEVDNVQKCLAAGFEQVVLISPEKKTLAKVKSLATAALPEDAQPRVHFCTPEEAFACLESIAAEVQGATRTVRGYKVKVRFHSLDAKERVQRRGAVSQVIAKALRRLQDRK